MSHLSEEILKRNAQTAKAVVANYTRTVGKNNQNLYKVLPRDPKTAGLYSSFREQKSQEKEQITENVSVNNPSRPPVLIKSIDTTEGSGPGSNISGNVNNSNAAKIVQSQKPKQ